MSQGFHSGGLRGDAEKGDFSPPVDSAGGASLGDKTNSQGPKDEGPPTMNDMGDQLQHPSGSTYRDHPLDFGQSDLHSPPPDGDLREMLASVPSLFLDQPKTLNSRPIRGNEFDRLLVPPFLGMGMALVQVNSVGICQSDVRYVKAKAEDFKGPTILGHEASGTVLRIGEGVENVRPGDRVAIDPQIIDPTTFLARRGKGHLESTNRFAATPPIHGLMTPFVVMPARNLYPSTLDPSVLCLSEPLACSLHAIMNYDVDTYAKEMKALDPERPLFAAVLGNGSIGLLVALALAERGYDKVIVTGVRPEKLNLIHELGFDDKLIPLCVSNNSQQDIIEGIRRMVKQEINDPHASEASIGVEALFAATSRAHDINGLLEVLTPGAPGAVIIGGVDESVVYPGMVARRREVRLNSSRRYHPSCFGEAVRMLEAHSDKFKRIVTNTFTGSDARGAFQHVMGNSPATIKVVVEYEPG